jgi:hypothetical protein
MAADASKFRDWTRHIKNWEASGLSQRAYCEREGLKISTFDYWRRQIRANTEVVKPEKKRSTALTLVPVHVSDNPAQDPLILRSPTGWELRLASAESVWLSDLLKRLV